MAQLKKKKETVKLKEKESIYISIDVEQKKEMKHCQSGLLLLLKRLVVPFSPTGSNNDGLLTGFVCWKLDSNLNSSSSPFLTVHTLTSAGFLPVWAGSSEEGSGAVGSEVIFSPLHPPWFSKSSAPCRRMHLRWSRDPPLKDTHGRIWRLFPVTTRRRAAKRHRGSFGWILTLLFVDDSV